MMDLEGIQKFAETFALRLEPHEHGATVVTLSGELGAGKTAFAQAAAQTLGVVEEVTSPTFVIEKIYKLQNQKFERFVHIDAYRLDSSHELEVLGFRELLLDSGNLIFIEWPERVPDVLPKDAIRLRFDIHGDERTISIDGREEENSE